MKPTIAGITFGAVISLAPIMPVSTDCPSAWRENVYDTPSGTLEAGYYVAPLPEATTTPIKEARVVSQRHIARCFDADGNGFLVPITEEEFKLVEPEKTVYIAPVKMLTDAVL